MRRADQQSRPRGTTGRRPEAETTDRVRCDALGRRDRMSLVRDPSGVEAIQACFGGHAYDLHRHDDWLVGATDYGVQDFFCRGVRHHSTTGRIILIEPGEAHDGRAGTPDGFGYQMLYLPQHWLTANVPGARAGEPAIRYSLSDDPRLAAAIRIGCRTLSEPSPRLTRDAALDNVVRWLSPHLGYADPRQRTGGDIVVARRARDRLEACLTDDIGADALASAAGANDRFQLARAFRAAYGTSPHAFLVQVRLMQARRRLAQGEAPAEVAAGCGFADQSHLGRWFRRAYGMTPASYRACCTNVPDRPAGLGR
jgi:AraC-like DNA-binding protein